MTQNEDNTIKVKCTQGANAFIVGDKFTFDTTFDYDEYRGSLSEPDCDHGPGDAPATAGVDLDGRSRAVITHNNLPFTLE